MKTKKIELDVDFIGGQTSLTKEQEKILSDYFRKTKIKKARLSSRKSKTVKQTV
jgi:hypothetical protein